MSWVREWKHYLKAAGPGVITGASDNDPAGISTYSVTGAQTGYSLLWVSLLSFPLMVAVQDISARIGAVREEGLGGVIRDRFGPGWLTVAMIALVISNVATIGADLAGVAAALSLITGVGIHIFVVPIALLIVFIQTFWSYRLFARYMKYLTIILFSYVIAGFISQPDWGAVWRHTVIPSISWDKGSLAILVGIFGTTISPYMFFWQASEEVEELHEEERHPPIRGDESERSEHWRLIDTIAGMFYAVIIFYFIVLTSAATLHTHGKTILTAAEAASALRPIAGDYAYYVFSIGIIGAGLIAVPVLAGSTAYPMSELFRRPEGLDKSIHQARFFYMVLAASVVLGMVIALLPINPIKALVYSQVLQGIMTPVLLVMLMLVSRNKEIMGEDNVNKPFFNIFGWLATSIITLADVALLWSLL